MFNLSKEQKQKYARITVLVTIVGLVMAYVPLLFLQQEEQALREPVQQSQTREASLVESVENSNVLPQPTSTPTTTPNPEGFSGVEEEGNSLNDLDTLLNQ